MKTITIEPFNFRTYTLDKDHNVIPAEENDFSIWNISRRRVAEDDIGLTRISTIFLCVDPGLVRGGIPMLFETMVFGPLDLGNEIQERCSTWDEALLQHKRIVEELRLKIQ